MPVRSPQQPEKRRSVFLRGAAGACLCAAAIGTVAGAMQLLGFGWPAGDRGSGTARIGGMPDDSGLVMLSPLATDGTRTHQQKKKPQAHAWACGFFFC